MSINKTCGENASGHILRTVVGILALVFVMIAYTGVVGAQGMDVTLNPTEGAPGTQVTATGSNWPAGHTIHVLWDENQSQDINQTTVDSNGNFTTTFLVPSYAGQGQHNILFWDEQGRTFSPPKVFTVTSSTPPSTPVSTFNISGFKINNATGEGIQGWNITLSNSTMQTSMLTGADGSYEFTNLVNGTYNVAEELQSGWTNVSPMSQQITINGADMNANFTNQPTTQTPPPTVHITANPPTHDINVSTNFTFTANPVGSWGNNISYSWSIASEKCFTAAVILTGQNISEHLDVACGNATISVIAEDEKGNKANDTYLVTVHENATSPPSPTEEPVLTIITVSPSTAMLNVTETQPFTATALDQNNTPISGINISWTISNSTVGSVTPLFAVTGMDGNASTTFTASAAGTTTVTATNGTVSASSDVTVAAITPTPEPTIPIPTTPVPTYSITGTVFVDADQNGIQDNGEKGYSGATIALNTGFTATTDSDGKYAFPNLPSGTYVEALTVPDGYKATTQSLVNIELNRNTIQNFGIVPGYQPREEEGVIGLDRAIIKLIGNMQGKLPLSPEAEREFRNQLENHTIKQAIGGTVGLVCGQIPGGGEWICKGLKDVIVPNLP